VAAAAGDDEHKEAAVSGNRTSDRAGRLLAAATLLGAAALPLAVQADEAVFASPEAALEALRAALDSDDPQLLVDLLGPENRDDIVGGDPAEARQAVAAARAAAEQGLRLGPGDDENSRTVLMGLRNWPMPFPLVKGERGWSFDVEAGLEEIIDRRIGENELTVIANADIYIDAQQLYAREDHDGDEVLEYAQKLISSPGRQDGLYWPDPTGSDPSPLGPLVASEADYQEHREAGESLHGYYYKILTAQGPNPPGGDYDYVINGNMIAGFALIAWPADYGSSGIMTFVISHQGRLYQKDLGEASAEIAAAIERYDPDPTWAEVALSQ
jgi:hypothetical protein